MLPIRPDPPCIDVVCRGAAAERGAMQGEQLRSQILGCAQAVYELEALKLQRPWWLPLRAFVRLADWKAAQALDPVLRTALPDAWIRLQAMSGAAGVRLPRLALINAMEAVLSDLTRSVVTGVEAACSAIAIAPEYTAVRGPIVAHNFDYLPLVQPFYIVRDERPAGGLRSLQFTAAPLAGAIDGLNEAGLAVTYNYAFATDRNVAAPTLSMRLAEALATCRTVPEAVAYLTQHTRWGSGLIMLADATGACASLELSATRSAVRRPDSTGTVGHANRFRAAETCAVQIADDAVHGTHAPAALRGRRVHQSSERRECRLDAPQSRSQRVDLDDVSAWMADHGPDHLPGADTVCMHSDYWHTTACIQLLPAERRLRIAYAPACAATFTEFTL
jgi:alpha-D-ribose 1-methylphosphonate 5-triphosphate synthase subunit PhnG